MTTFGFTPRELAGLAEQAAQATFLDGAARARLGERVRSGWANPPSPRGGRGRAPRRTAPHQLREGRALPPPARRLLVGVAGAGAAVASSKGRPTSWRPTGRPSPEKPQGTAERRQPERVERPGQAGEPVHAADDLVGRPGLRGRQGRRRLGNRGRCRARRPGANTSLDEHGPSGARPEPHRLEIVVGRHLEAHLEPGPDRRLERVRATRGRCARGSRRSRSGRSRPRDRTGWRDRGTRHSTTRAPSARERRDAARTPPAPRRRARGRSSGRRHPTRSPATRPVEAPPGSRARARWAGRWRPAGRAGNHAEQAAPRRAPSG